MSVWPIAIMIGLGIVSAVYFIRRVPPDPGDTREDVDDLY
ncbi:prolipoprotein diacylglyceryl transferase [Paenibacillus mucilaginosus]|uniref:Uncharacterized protein n=1 Tax=Paenibacillus mucilaginosus (strain KNP414) TaxID=1036673 RepID=F8F4K5_PAEMK|nr:hypothetical protein KNP414_00807 [Paenibacillus mucilaginosus KNP414]MCG7214764.1 prolipoprotein diacylglyceryl transferase [Paenibacillus mucilaginosus]